MARIEWVKLRLNNWALWKVREASGGLGFASQSALMREPSEQSFRESTIPVDEVDASVTNEAVESLKGTRRHLYDCLQCYYVAGKGISGTAVTLGKAESTIKAQFEQADLALSIWFIERHDRQKAARDALKR